MMKIVALLMALFAAVTVQTAQAQVACFMHYTRAEAGKSGSNTFTGITNTTGFENYNNPIFSSKTNVAKGYTGSSAIGRFSGKLPTTTYEGSMQFDFFAKKDQIKFTFKKSTGKGVLKSGKGCYAGITGTVTRTQIGTSLPKIFEWKFCPMKKPTCVAK